MEEVIADLHIHSRFSRATSKELSIENLEKWAKIKGVGLLGTGDFQHAHWWKEIDALEEREGILYSKGGFPFVLQTEISLMYTQDGKGRRIHYVILAPGKEVGKQITLWLASKGRLDYDGRPIFGFNSIELVDELMKISDKIELIPAHIWTPWFGIFGSKTGFDSLKQCFGEKENKIHAIETGLSSNPSMNWKISELNNRTIISSSDLHSFWPWRIGREATIFSNIRSYDGLIKQIREDLIKGTVEVNPAYGKYHWDGHRNCNFSCSPEKTKQLGGKCPKCGNQLTVGVEYRVEELADQEAREGKSFYELLPLHEIISLCYGSGMNTAKVWGIYNQLIEKYGNEFNVLLNISKVDLLKDKFDEKLVGIIMLNRHNKINVKPGFDGQYGVAKVPNFQKKLI